MIDVYFANGPWHEEVRSYADPPAYIELEGGEYIRTRLSADDSVRLFYVWFPLDQIAKFARDIERVAEESGYDGHRFREAA